MKKYLIFLLLILFSCQRDELWDVEPTPKNNMIFETTFSTCYFFGILFYFKVSNWHQPGP